MALTKMMCMDGNGETVFLQTLKTITTWSISEDNKLIFKMDDLVMMQFSKSNKQ
jgi:hypothetical protein